LREQDRHKQNGPALLLARLAQQLIDQRGLAVINVRNDGDVTDLFHGGLRGAEYRRAALKNQPTCIDLTAPKTKAILLIS
jgi:hypothetical protein